MRFVVALLVCLTLFGLANRAIAQGPDSQGREFFVTFIPNLHVNEPAFDSLHIYVVASRRTSVTITATNRQGVPTVTTRVLVNAGDIWDYVVHWRDYELWGMNQENELFDANAIENQNARPAPQHFRVVSTEDVTVYALSQAITTSDAFLVLPVDALGKEHYVMSYNSDGVLDQVGISLTTASTPSQFAIVATEDNTQVQVQPSAPVIRGNTYNSPVTLNRGQSLLVQANLFNTSNRRGDLTGSKVISDKPVAVFSGHQRLRVPINLLGSAVSRDVVIEQLPPVASWGINAFVVPFVQPNSIGTTSENDRYRVIASVDSTIVRLNGVVADTLNAGQFFEREITVPVAVSADRPIMTAVFKKTASTSPGGGAGNFSISDPFMMVIPPKEQYMNSYRFINVQAVDVIDENNGQVTIDREGYKEQYACLVFDTSSFSTIVLDGAQLQALSLAPTPIPGTSFAFLNVPVAAGAHSVQSAQPLGLYVYGYGRANSYGYIGGLSVAEFDGNRPVIASTEGCYEVRGTVTDSLPGDRGIQRVNQIIDSNKNTSAQVNPPTRPRGPATFSASLINRFDDGRFAIIAEDSVGQINARVYPIPGFTVAVIPSPDTSQIPRSVRSTPTGVNVCEEFKLINYGAFRQTIRRMSLKSNRTVFRILSGTPINIPAGDTATVTVCFLSPDEDVFVDTLVIDDGCSERDVQALRYVTLVDRNQPTVNRLTDPCVQRISYRFFDSSQVDAGMRDVRLVEAESENVRGSVVSGQGTEIEYLVEVIDVDQDAVIAVQGRDLAGNSRTIRDTIPGFTLTFGPEGRTRIDFDTSVVTDTFTDSLLLTNYGRFRIELTSVQLDSNVVFSVPQAQLPFSIEPGQTRALTIVYTPLNARTLIDEDTLKLGFRCTSRTFPLSGIPAILDAGGTYRCNIPVTTWVVSVPMSLSSIRPNPSSTGGLVTVEIESETGGLVDVSVLNMAGTLVRTLPGITLQAGKNNLNMLTDGLAAGTYRVVARSGHLVSVGTMVVTP